MYYQVVRLIGSQFPSVLSLDKKNGKAIGRKIKAMCSLGKFRDAHTIAKSWIREDTKNPQAKKEVERLDVIIKALNEQVSIYLKPYFYNCNVRCEHTTCSIHTIELSV